MKKILIQSVLILFTIFTQAQTYHLPPWASIYRDHNGNQQSLSKDFDGDGIPDLAIVCHDGVDQVL